MTSVTHSQLRRLQSVMNTAARSITSLRRSDHITETLASLHWLRSSERIQYKLVTTVFRSLHGLASPHLSDDLHRLVDLPSRRRLRSASSLQLDVPRTHRRTVGDRAFTAAGPTLWNSLPHGIAEIVFYWAEQDRRTGPKKPRFLVFLNLKPPELQFWVFLKLLFITLFNKSIIEVFTVTFDNSSLAWIVLNRVNMWLPCKPYCPCILHGQM